MALTADEKLTGTKLLDFCLMTIPLLRHLRDTKTTMRYGELATRIGLVRTTDEWRRKRFQISKILYAVAATDKYSGDPEFTEADYARFVGPDDKPGKGLWKTARIIVSGPDNDAP